MEIPCLPDEYWWGGRVEDGVKMPFGTESDYRADLSQPTPNQSAPFFLSSKGRYLWSETPFCIRFQKGIISVQGEQVQLESGFQNLKGAYLAAQKAHFPFTGTMPNPLFFLKPQYNTWIPLNHNQTQQGVLEYASQIKRFGLMPGIFMIDSGWERYFGELDFDRSKFPEPKKMIQELHRQGFTVMLWISPCISPDSPTFRKLREGRGLLRNSDGEIAVRKWWDGYSAVLDLSDPVAEDWFSKKLDVLKINYGVDGFKIDGGDFYFYREDDRSCGNPAPQMQSRAMSLFAERYDFHELRVAWKCGGRPLVMRLCDKQHSWEEYGLNMVLPNTLVQGLLGYPYCCPDMIGGGEYMQMNRQAGRLDEELFVRYAQAAALLPMMQFSALPNCLEDESTVSAVCRAAQLHVLYGPYILESAKHCAKTGEPIVRHMAYSYPDGGYENVNDQFMLGEDILVAPVLKKGMCEKIVFLPEGSWKYGPTKKVYRGGETYRVKAELETLPYFIRV